MSEDAKSDVAIRPGRREDGAAVWRLVRESRVLDVNSSYAYLLFLDHFGDTSVVAERAGEPVGFVTGFRPPRRPDVIFVWQVAVDASMRGRGLAGGMLDALLRLDACRGVRYLETTVTPTNAPSRALFASFARAHGAEHEVSPYFGEDLFPDGGHEAEELHRIGPISTAPSTPRSPSMHRVPQDAVEIGGKGTPPPARIAPASPRSPSREPGR